VTNQTRFLPRDLDRIQHILLATHVDGTGYFRVSHVLKHVIRLTI